MANTFLTPSIIGKEALLILENELVATSLFHRGHTQEFTGSKVGDTISIRGPAAFTAQEWSGSTTTQDATETSTSLTLEKHFDVTFAVTARDKTLELAEFNSQLLQPAVAAIAQGIDSYIHTKYVEIPYYVGTAGDPPDSLTDLALIDKALNDQKVPLGNRFAIVNTQAKADMFGISAVAQAEQRGDGGDALRNASMGRIMGLDFYMSQNVADHAVGTLTNGSGMLAKINNASVSVGDTSVAMDETSLSGTVKKGDIFTVAGDTQKYVATADATASGNAITVSFSPAAKVAWADDAVVTFTPDSDYAANIAGHPNGLTVAMVPLELPDGAAQAAYIGDRNLGLRIVMDYDMSSKTDTISIDVLCGAKVQHPELLTRVLG